MVVTDPMFLPMTILKTNLYELVSSCEATMIWRPPGNLPIQTLRDNLFIAVSPPVYLCDVSCVDPLFDRSLHSL